MCQTARWKEQLRALHPCPEAYRWACGFNTLQEAWRACENGEWMGWLLTVTHEEDVLCAVTKTTYWGMDDGRCNCVDHFMPDPPELP